MKEKLLQLINQSNTISFDIFDTLILRNIFNPTDIFKILSNFAYDKFKIENFAEIRVRCEKNSRVISNNYESNLDEIYDLISVEIGAKKANQLKNKELELELQFCVANPFMKEIFDYAISKKKKVIIISDMYLKKNFILKILNKEGYKNVDLYISNEFRKNKGTLELYEEIYQKNHFEKNKWLHIGDNVLGDYEAPLKFGIKAYNYKKVASYTDMRPNSIFESIMLAIQCNYLYNGKNLEYWDAFGVKYVSSIYFGFTKWLYDLTRNENNLFFIARDGYIIDKIYQLFNKDKKVKTKYLYCSRRSLQIPSLVLSSKDNLIQTLTQDVNIQKQLTLKEYLEKAQVNLEYEEDIKLLLPSFGFSSLKDIVSQKNQRSAKKLVAKLYENIKDHLESEKEIVISYLKQEGLSEFEKINIMDIGWAGSIQDAISKLLNKRVVGYYFGTINQEKEDAFTNMFGYYFDLDNKLEDKNKVFSQPLMYEFLFSAPHGSTLRYKRNKNRIEPVLSTSVSYSKVMEVFQKSALELVQKYIEYIEYFDLVDKHFCLKPYQEFIDNRNYEDMKKFSMLSNDFILGVEKEFSYVNFIPFQDVIDETDNFVKLAEESLWKGTFLIEGDVVDVETAYNLIRRKSNHLRYRADILTPLKSAKVYLDCGHGFNEEDVFFVPYNVEGNKYSFELKINEKVKGVRIDPVEGEKVKIRNLIITTNRGNMRCFIPHRNYFVGKLEQCIYISSKDPKIILKNANDLETVFFSACIELIK